MTIDTFRTSDHALGYSNRSVFKDDSFAKGFLFVTTDRRTISCEILEAGEGRIEIDPIEKVLKIKAEVITEKGKKYIDEYYMDKGEWSHAINLNTNLDFVLNSQFPEN